MNCVVGTCSLCGGPVHIPVIWHGVESPIPTCRDCGATKARPHGAVIEMERPRQQLTDDEVNRGIDDYLTGFPRGWSP